MKKYALLFVALCACVAISCHKEAIKETVEEVENASEVKMKTVTISATMEDAMVEGNSVNEIKTRTSYTDGTTFKWTAGDEISVLCSDGELYTFTANSTGSGTTFTGSVPDGVSLDAKAYFPADAGHTSSKYSLPYYKDISGHDSADIPMYGTKGEGNVYAFKHCAGAALLTIENIPAGVTAATITVRSTNSGDPEYKYKISGLFSISTKEDPAYPKWNGEYAADATNENVYSRKVSVSNNTAKLYIPCPAGADNWVPNILNVTGHTSEGDIALFTDKAMKKLGTVARSHVLPLTPLVYSQIGKINWSGVSAFPASSGNRVKEWKVTSDKYFVYVYMKYDKADAASKGSSNYLYVGFDTDNNPATGDATSYLGTLEAQVMFYPVSSYSEGVFTFNPSNSNNYVQCPIGTTNGKPTLLGSYDASDIYAEIAIQRSQIGSPASGSTIGVKVAVRSESTAEQTITLN